MKIDDYRRLLAFARSKLSSFLYAWNVTLAYRLADDAGRAEVVDAVVADGRILAGSTHRQVDEAMRSSLPKVQLCLSLVGGTS
jgi:hypothetical protein